MLMKIIAYNFLERLSIPAKRRHDHFLSLVISIKNIILNGMILVNYLFSN